VLQSRPHRIAKRSTVAKKLLERWFGGLSSRSVMVNVVTLFWG